MTVKRLTAEDIRYARLQQAHRIATAHDQHNPDGFAWSQAYLQDMSALTAEVTDLRARLSAAEQKRDNWRCAYRIAVIQRDRARDYVASLHGGRSYQQVDELVTRCDAAQARAEAAERIIARLLAGEPWGAFSNDGSGRTLEDDARAALAGREPQ